ncbi:MAG: xanthine dehydrogenase family protein subunit M [Kangiellaceae bacterium]|jgi:carbon-monoxide dehydrogenase medium subunit|nr:xanthine dehydrogenase family protein subunit M [Kangiellaceae bacterium]
MIPSTFDYHKATSVEDAIAKLSENEDAKLLAGGHSLLPMMKLRFAEPPCLVDINGIEELKGITVEGDHLVIGAMTTENEVIFSDTVAQYCPLLVSAAKLVADPQVRNRGTIGGDVAHGDPGNDHPAVMLSLDATLVIQGPDGRREEPANGFFLGTYWTGLGEHDILVAIKVPVKKANTGYGYSKLKRKTGDYAVAGSSVVVEMNGDTISEIRIGLTNVSATAIRAEAAEDILRGNALTDDLLEQAAKAIIDACDPAVDLRGDEEYKAHMAAEMSRRAIRQAVADGRG